MTNSGPAAPPGWYPDAAGRLVWWDGTRWTGYVAERPADRTWAVLAHASFFALGIVAPLVILLTLGRTDRYVKHHASEALNAQIWFMGIWICVIMSMFVATAVTLNHPGFVFLAFPFAGLVFLGFATLAVVGAVQASRGAWWRYPLPFRFVPGADGRG